MTDIADFIRFVEQERLAQEAEVQGRDMLSIRALVSLGHAIDNLRVVTRNGDALQMVCSENHSRFRPGDRLIFRHPHLPAFRATLYDLADAGKRLSVPGSTLPEGRASGSWIAIEDATNLTYSVQTALQKLQPGVPGWSFAKRLLGQGNVSEPRPNPAHRKLLEEMVAETGLVMDDSQGDAFLQCVAAPPVLGVQGPPGTGKTLVLAFVAEALMRLGKRVVLLAPTHQAINNTLTTLYRLFPERRVKKFGDELRTESLAGDIPIITSPLKISKEPLDTLIGLTFMSALHQLMISDQKMVAPNVVIIDEAGQLPAAQGLCTGLSGAGSILLFGDDKQMPPVFPGELSEEPLAVSLFAQLRSSQPQAIRMLNTTYRLNEQLCRAISSTFYVENAAQPLRPAPEAGGRRFSNEIVEKIDAEWMQQALSPQASLVWLQVPSRNCTQFNHAEAQVAANLVVDCLKAGLSSHEIAVVTPFRRQVMHIRNLISAQLGDNYELPIVDTVERVQGLTVEAVVVSFCASEPDYIASIADFLYSPNRLNVAVSRARTKAVVISHPDVFHTLPRSFLGFQARDLCQKFLKSPESFPLYL
jgi:hypothetical protein